MGSSGKWITIKVGKASIKAEFSKSFLKKAKGLMFRRNLPTSQGMIFVFPKEGYHTFWMMFTRIPLDIIWINSFREIVHIERDLKPKLISFKTYRPNEKAKYVLEIWAKSAEKFGIKVGDKVQFESS